MPIWACGLCFTTMSTAYIMAPLRQDVRESRSSWESATPHPKPSAVEVRLSVFSPRPFSNTARRSENLVFSLTLTNHQLFRSSLSYAGGCHFRPRRANEDKRTFSYCFKYDLDLVAALSLVPLLSSWLMLSSYMADAFIIYVYIYAVSSDPTVD